MITEVGGFSEKGKREVNQDRILNLTDGEKGLFLVSDGMGGHSEGERASQTISTLYEDWWNTYDRHSSNNSFAQDVEKLRKILESANSKIWEETMTGICGATIVLLWVKKNQYALFWSGDSRCYTVARKRIFPEITQLTADDVWQNSSEARKKMRVQTNNAEYGKLVRAVGVNSDSSFYTVRTGIIKSRTTFLLCSDGVYKYMNPKDFSRTVLTFHRNGLQKELFGTVKKNVYSGSRSDNVSLVYAVVNK